MQKLNSRTFKAPLSFCTGQLKEMAAPACMADMQ